MKPDSFVEIADYLVGICIPKDRVMFEKHPRYNIFSHVTSCFLLKAQSVPTILRLWVADYSYAKLCQMLSWWTKNLPHSINIWDLMMFIWIRHTEYLSGIYHLYTNSHNHHHIKMLIHQGFNTWNNLINKPSPLKVWVSWYLCDMLAGACVSVYQYHHAPMKNKNR